MDTHFGQAPLHDVLRRQVDAVLSLPPAALNHAACDTLQRAVNAVCAGGLSREWVELFLTLVRRIPAGDDRPTQVLELARSTRAFIDRVQPEPWAALARELSSD